MKTNTNYYKELLEMGLKNYDPKKSKDNWSRFNKTKAGKIINSIADKICETSYINDVKFSPDFSIMHKTESGKNIYIMTYIFSNKENNTGIMDVIESIGDSGILYETDIVKMYRQISLYGTITDVVFTFVRDNLIGSNLSLSIKDREYFLKKLMLADNSYTAMLMMNGFTHISPTGEYLGDPCTFEFPIMQFDRFRTSFIAINGDIMGSCYNDTVLSLSHFYLNAFLLDLDVDLIHFESTLDKILNIPMSNDMDEALSTITEYGKRKYKSSKIKCEGFCSWFRDEYKYFTSLDPDLYESAFKERFIKYFINGEIYLTGNIGIDAILIYGKGALISASSNISGIVVSNETRNNLKSKAFGNGPVDFNAELEKIKNMLKGIYSSKHEDPVPTKSKFDDKLNNRNSNQKLSDSDLDSMLKDIFKGFDGFGDDR